MIIYKITNKINGKIYIGQTRLSLEKRWKKHLYDAKRQGNNKFYKAINKYGAENFAIDIIEEGIKDIEQLNAREMYWIKKYDSYNNGYNSTVGGEVSPMHYEEVRNKVSKSLTGREFSCEHRMRISQARKGKGHPHTEEYKVYMSNLLKGRQVSEQTRELLRWANIGKKQSKETIEKRRKAMTGRKFTKEHTEKLTKVLNEHRFAKSGKEHPRSKSVVKIDINTGEELERFDSASLAEQSLNKNKNSGAIIKVCNGQRKTAYGFKWKWA